MTSVSRLPGVYFSAEVPAERPGLPRMDIAAFVGFAASGPLDLPVAVEDAGRFQEIFGKDLPLAVHASTGETRYAQLGPAVRAYFRNAGRRCWVVRVAGEKASANRFLLPGMLCVEEELKLSAAWLAARSEGSWSDGLEVNATLSVTPLGEIGVQAPKASLLKFPASARITAGDVIQLFAPSRGIIGYAVASRVVPERQDAERSHQRVELGAGCWFQRMGARRPEWRAGTPPAPEIKAAHSLRPRDAAELSILQFTPDAEQERFALIVSREDGLKLSPGGWLRLEVANLTGPRRATLLLMVDRITASRSRTVLPAASPPAEPDNLLEISCREAWRLLPAKSPLIPNSGAIRAATLELELWVRQPGGGAFRLGGLGLAPAHSLFWGNLPADAQLFAPEEEQRKLSGRALFPKVSSPRFPLAGPREASSAGLLLTAPLGVFGTLRDEYFQPAEGAPQAESSLERNGLDVFSHRLFIDESLSDSGASTLLADAFYRQFQAPAADQAKFGRARLKKIHALLPIEEVSLLAVPDAMHEGWARNGGPHPLLGAPNLEVQKAMAGEDAARLTWSRVAGAQEYLVEVSGTPQFERAQAIHRGPQLGCEARPRRDCPQALFFRVRAQAGVEKGPWSNAASDVLPKTLFVACHQRQFDAPKLDPPWPLPNRTVLTWSSVSGAEKYSLEISRSPDFLPARELYRGRDVEFRSWNSGGEAAYYRVCALRGEERSPWSNTQFIVPPQKVEAWRIREGDGSDEARADALLKIHKAMLVFCAARGDVFAVLGLPRGFRAGEAAAYREKLAGMVDPGAGEHTLSFGALYHPWTVVQEQPRTSGPRAIAPEGAVCGVLAARAIRHGAWVAPANERLRGVIALEPFLDAAALECYVRQVNLARQDPRGFMLLSAKTLSPAAEWQDINVRRLIILLRRVALREGMGYAFEPNDASFRRRVQRHFEALLGELFVRGAFAGATPAEGFRVVTDESVNTRESLEAGRFIVELRVAPSRPLEFLTVQLIQSGSEVRFREGV